jgi:hypothetical protein
MRKTYELLVGKPEEKRPLGGPRCRWEDNTVQDRFHWQVLVKMVIHFFFPFHGYTSKSE